MASKGRRWKIGRNAGKREGRRREGVKINRRGYRRRVDKKEG